MSKKIKLCYFQIIDGSEKEVQKLSKELGKIKDTVGMEFLVGNERIELHNVKYLLDSLYALYKQMTENEKNKK